MKSFAETKKESTCQKRITVCEIYDKYGELLVRESNRCCPEGGVCHRLGQVNTKLDYPETSHCNWTHAEIAAVQKWDSKRDGKPYRSVLYGHDFYCDACEKALKKIGVQILEIKTDKIFVTVLEEAQSVVYGDRQADYGSATENFTNVANFWNAALRKKLKEPITAEDTALCMILVKVARQINKPKRDNIIDIAGYAATIEKLNNGQ